MSHQRVFKILMVTVFAVCVAMTSFSDTQGVLTLTDYNQDNKIGLQDVIHELQIIAGFQTLPSMDSEKQGYADIVIVAERGTIKGNVKEDTGNQNAYIPLQDVKLVFECSNGEIYSLNSNEQGLFKLDSIPIGTHTVRAEKEGYYANNVTVTMDQVMSLELNIALKPENTSPGQVTGYVYFPNANGQLVPLAQAVVSLFPVPDQLIDTLSRSASLSQSIVNQQVKTNELGFYHFNNVNSGRYFVMAERDGYQKALSITSVTDQRESRLNLVVFKDEPTQGGSLIVKVSENALISAGVSLNHFIPVTNATVTLSHTTLEIAIQSIQTDSQGWAKFSDLPWGEYVLTVEHPQFKSHRQTVSILENQRIPLPVIQPYSIQVDPATGIPGTAIDSAAMTVENDASLGNTMLQYIQNTSAGCFCIGPYQQWHQEPYYVNVILERNQYIEDTIQLSGHVFAYNNDTTGDANRKPIEGAVISLTPYFPYPTLSPNNSSESGFAPLPVFTAKTDQAGYYLFEKLPVSYLLDNAVIYLITVEASGFEPIKQKIVLDPQKENIQDFMLNLPPKLTKLSGHVYDGAVKCDDGEKCILPIQRAGVHIFASNPNILINTIQEYHTVTDENGLFVFPNVIPASYNMIVRADQYMPWEGTIEIKQDEENIYDVRLMPMDTKSGLHGHVFLTSSTCDPNTTNADCSIPIVGATLILTHETQANYQFKTQTNETGFYSFSNLIAGAYIIEIINDQTNPFKETIRIPASSDVRKEFYLYPTSGVGKLHGMIRDGSVRCILERCIAPITNASISLYEKTSDATQAPVYQTESNGEGLYEFAEIKSNAYIMTVVAEGYQTWRQTVFIQSDHDTTLDAVLMPELPKGRLEGHIYSISKNDTTAKIPLKNARISLYSDQTNAANTTVSDAEGAFIFDEITVGYYVIVIEAAGHEPMKDELTITEGDQQFETDLVKLPTCLTNENCNANEICLKPTGHCDSEGICKVVTNACPEIYNPVCGCDQKTYGNECEAWANGVNVLYNGFCQSSGETGLLYGQVFDATLDFGPIADVDIQLFQESPLSSVPPITLNTHTDSEGRFEIKDIPVSLYVIELSKDGYQRQKHRITIMPNDVITKEFNLMPINTTKTSLEGTVQSVVDECLIAPCQIPVSDAIVQLYPTDLMILDNDTNQRFFEAITNQNGYFRLDDIPSGVYTIHVEAKTYNIFKQIITLNENQSNKLDVVLQKSITVKTILEGTVLDGLADCGITISDCEAGIPDAKCILTSSDPNGSMVTYSAITDRQGRFIIEGLLPAQYVLSIEAEGYQAITKDIVVQEGRNTIRVEIMPDQN